MLTVDNKVLADIGRGFAVPAQPDLLLKLQALMAEDDPNINTIAHTISQDVAISATILKTINSPIYGLARSVADIPMSVRYIGLNGIMTLVTGSLIKRSFKQEGCSIVLEEFWLNASNIANTCVFIGKRLKQAVSTDKLFSLGLFHDCGIPIMALKYPDYQTLLTQTLNTPNLSLTTVEDEAYQVNHAIIGFYVASSWRLPKDICQLILSHHDRNYLLEKNSRLQKFYYAILKLAENIVHQHQYFVDAPDWAHLQDAIFSLLDLDEDNYRDLVEDLAEQQC